MNATDPRIGRACEALEVARRSKPGALPIFVLMREYAEIRRRLGQVLEGLDHRRHSRSPAGTLRPAMADTLAFLERKAYATCGDCQLPVSGLCDDDAAGFDRFEAYGSLAASSGGRASEDDPHGLVLAPSHRGYLRAQPGR